MGVLVSKRYHRSAGVGFGEFRYSLGIDFLSVSW